MKIVPLLIRALKTYFLFLFCMIAFVIPFAAVRFVQIEREPNTHVKNFATDQFKVLSGGEIETINTVSVKKGCVATLARGFARIDPDHPQDIDIQIVTPAPAPIGINISDLNNRPSTFVVLDVRSEAKQDITYRIETPIPRQVLAGSGWRYVEKLSQPTCGWLHGILPIDTTYSIGPELILENSEEPVSLRQSGSSGQSGQ